MKTVDTEYHTSSDVSEKAERVNDAMFDVPRGTSAALLESLPGDVRRVYVTGVEPGGGGIVALRQWAQACGERWAPDGDQYVAVAQPRLTYRDVLTGRKVYVMRAAPWFGADAGPAVCAAAWSALEAALSAAWNFRGLRAGEWRPVKMFGTPATTGRLLLERQWAETGRVFEPVSAELRELIRTTSRQGRFELGPAADEGSAGGLWVYDAAFMYAACANELPTGPVRHDHGTTVPQYVRGRYRVDFRAPRSWAHIGLLGVTGERGMTYPVTSSEWHQTWADASEVQLALDYRWTVRPLERVLWETRSARPLDTWARRLVKVREGIDVPAGCSDELRAIGGAMRTAVRAMLVQTIGALTGAPRKVTRAVPLEDVAALPTGPVLEPTTVQGDQWVWTEAAPPTHDSMQHPEWAAHVWAKARTRLLADTHGAGALRVPPGELFALALDSIATTAPVPDWHGAGVDITGQFRLKQRVPGPVPACATLAEYYALAGEEA